jgi:hypothetical protein
MRPRHDIPDFILAIHPVRLDSEKRGKARMESEPQQMSMTCPECNKTKPHKYFCGKHNIAIFETCRDCRMTPHAERVARAEVVKASTVSKMAGTYTPAPWNIRNGSDAFMRIKSRYV